MNTEQPVVLGRPMDKAEEKALVRRLAGMDGGAWEAFCKEYAGPLLGFVQGSFRCSRVQAEDVVQMTFLRCVKSIQTFHPARGRLYGWLKAVAANEARTCLGKEIRNPADLSLSSVPRHVADQILETIDKTPLPEEVLDRKDVKIAIQETLMALRGRYRRALIAKYADGQKVADIASELGLSEKAVESLLSRSRQAFRDALLRKIGPCVRVTN